MFDSRTLLLAFTAVAAFAQTPTYSEMNAGARMPMMVSTEKGVRAIVDAIEKEKASARVPTLPWAPLGTLIRHAPLPVLKRFM